MNAWISRKLTRLRRASRMVRQTLNGERFREVERYIDRKLAEVDAGTFSLSHSMDRLTSQRASAASGRIAVVSCLPPTDTGIASATLLTFRDAPCPVDIFARFDSAEDYITCISGGRPADTRVRIFDLRLLPFALRQDDYVAQLYVLGNSQHHIAAASALRRAHRVAPHIPTFVHIHDPVLLRLMQLLAEAEKTTVQDMLHRSYGRWFERYNDDDLLGQGICGVRAVLGNSPVQGVIVNSRRAADIVSADLPDVPISTFFHPVFDMETAGLHGHVRDDDAFRIGTFGVPNDNKRTDLIVAAFRRFRTQFPRATLVVAGYSARKYARDHQLDASDGFEVHECDEHEFNQLICSVDLAIQLRALDMGESSGVLARLLTLDIPVVASPIGAFKDYGRAVRYFDQQGGPDELAQLMAELLRGGSADDLAARREYRAQHSPARFCQLLRDLATQTTAQRPQRQARGG